MATSNWAIPTGKAITGATYIKDTDDNIAATIEDLVDWCNNANGTYNDWTLTGLRTDFVTYTPNATITTTSQIKGITPVSAEDLTRKDYVDQHVLPSEYATSTVGGTVKARLSGTTLYITIDGTDA